MRQVQGRGGHGLKPRGVFALVAAALGLGAFLPPRAAAQEPVPPPLAAEGKVAADIDTELQTIYAPSPVTRAVDRGVDYLLKSQLPDGSWLSPMGKNTGITSLAVMAILSAGHEPGRGKKGEGIDRAVRFLLEHQRDGMINTSDTSHGPMYEHGISTLLLGEVLGMVNEERPGFEKIHRTHRAAVNLILRAQNVPKDASTTGGWRYTPGSIDSDLSVTGWQLLALRAAQDAGLAVPKKNIDQAVDYVKRCAHPSGGFSYMPGGEPNVARTGTGILSLQICGDFQSPEARRGGEWLLKNPLQFQGPFFYYSAYYSSQAMYQLGGEMWERWRPLSEGILLERQRTDGSWPAPPNETHEHQAGPAYTTALAILSLTVDYKFLPIYQR